MARRLHRLGRWCVQHRTRVLVLWLAALITVGVLAVSVGGEYADDFTVPDVESQAAVDLLRERFPDAAGGTALVVLHADEGPIDDRRAVDEVATTIGELPGVLGVEPPQLSPDGTTALIAVQYERELTDLTRGALTALLDARDPRAAPPRRPPCRPGHPHRGRRRAAAVRQRGHHRPGRARRSGRGRGHPAVRLRLGAGHGPAHRHRPVRPRPEPVADPPARPPRRHTHH